MRYKSKYFKRGEFVCKCGCGTNLVTDELLEVLDDVREHFGVVCTITSGTRCTDHNKKVGGSPRSMHKQGVAADIQLRGVAPADVYRYLDQKYNGKYGIGLYNSFVHVDTRAQKARW